MHNEDHTVDLVELGVASQETRGSWYEEQDSENGRMPPPGLIGG